VLDGAHNPHGIEGVVNTLQREPWNRYRWHLLFAVLKDKPGLQMLDLLLPWVASVVVTRVPSERGTDPELLAAHIPPTWRPEPVLSLVDALERVKSRVAADNDAVLITGSLSLLMHLTQLGILVDA
jgi:dihydrofolate synthase/folylpolyglutamate synthase